MKIFKILLFSVLVISCVGDKKNASDASTEESESGDWVSLIGENDLKGWRGYLQEDLATGWSVEDGVLAYTPDPDNNPGMNNLITEKEYGSFELKLEWKIEADGNSGVFYWVQEDEKYVVPYMTAPEVQLRDYSSNPEFSDNTQMSGAIFGLIGPEKNHAKPPGAWNKLWLSVDLEKNLGQVKLNDRELFEYPVYGEDWDSMVAMSKFKDWEGFAKKQKGHIGLQDHAHKVWFRNIEIKELKENE